MRRPRSQCGCGHGRDRGRDDSGRR